MVIIRTIRKQDKKVMDNKVIEHFLGEINNFVGE